jgi:hypothetical protein
MAPAVTHRPFAAGESGLAQTLAIVRRLQKYQ